MTSPTAETLLGIWERGWQQRPARQALLLLTCVGPTGVEAELAALPLGERNRRLIRLRQELFGDELTAAGTCPACTALLELPLTLSGLIAPGRPPATRFQHAGIDLEFRTLTSADLLDLPDTPEDARATLLARAVLTARRREHAVPVAELPGEVVAALEEALELADPQATLEFALSCPACQHQWLTLLDIGQVLWREVEHWAKRTLLDVHRLASAYHWSQADILNLSAGRRQLYLQLLP